MTGMTGQKNLERIVRIVGQINVDIYPTDEERSNENISYSSVYMSDFDHSKPLDKTIIYSTSTGNYADAKTHWISEIGTANTPLTYAQTEIMNNSYMSYGLMYSDNRSGHTGQFSGYGDGNPNLTMSEKLSNNWNRTSIPDYFSGNGFITGFKYHAIVGVIRILCHSRGYGNIADVDFDTYFNNPNYSNHKIFGVYLTAWSGSPTSRTSTSIQPFRYTPTVVLGSWLGNSNDLFERKRIEGDTTERTYPIPPNSDDAKSKYQVKFTPINNYSMFGQRGNVNYRGVTLFGRDMMSSYNFGYRSSNANLNDASNSGWQFHNSQLSDWDNMIWVVNGNEYTFDEMYHGTRTNQGFWKPTYNLSAEDILRMCATVGIIFTTKENHGKTANLTMNDKTKPDEWGDGVLSPDTYFPKKTGGYWQGDYTHGQDNANAEQIQNSWNTDKNAPFVNGSDYGEGGQDAHKGDIHTDNSSTVMPNFNNVYVVTSDILRQLSEYLNNSDDSIFDQILKCLEYSGSNPINSVQAVMHLPVGLKGREIGYNDDIIIGRLNTKIKGQKLSQMVYNVNMGTTGTIAKHHNNYLDYAPYTSFIAWVPYCGFVDLEPNLLYGKTVSFMGYVDVLSGSISVDISVGGSFYKTVSGSCATPIPLQAFDTASYIGGVINSAGSMGSSLIATAGGVTAMATGNVGMGAMATLSGISGGINSLYNFATSPQNFVNVGGSPSGSAMMKMPRQCGIYQYTRDAIIDDESLNKIGRACSMSKTLSDLHGFTQIGNADISGITATDREKSELKQLLESGVYLN